MEALPNPDYRYLSVYDVLNIPLADTPMVVLSDNMESLISRRIIFWSNLREGHAAHRYSHAMFLRDPETLASQGLFYKAHELTGWVQDYLRLKFWYCVLWTENDRALIRRHIDRELSMRWYRRIYDAPGVGGQWLQSVFGWGAWLNVPGIDFCSPRTAGPIRRWTPMLSRQPSPADMDRYFEESAHWKCYGVYDPRSDLDD